MGNMNIINKICSVTIKKWNIKKLSVLDDGVQLRINDHVIILIKDLDNDLYNLNIITKSIEDNVKTDKYKNINLEYLVEKINEANGE